LSRTTTTTVRDGLIDSVGTDYVIWRDGETRLQVKFKDDSMLTKEDWALNFRGFEGKRAVISVDGPLYISMSVMPGHFEGTLRVIPGCAPVESVTAL